MAETLQHPYIKFEGTKAWIVLDTALIALVKNGDVLEQTDRRYIVGYLCKALAESEVNS